MVHNHPFLLRTQHKNTALSSTNQDNNNNKKPNAKIRPDSRSFSHIIDYYSRSRKWNAPERAEWILMGMIKMFTEGHKDVLPNIFCFTSVIGSFAKRNDPNAGLCAERILQYMEDVHRNYNASKLTPNTFIMKAVLNAWSKSGNPRAGERSEQILLHMEGRYNAGRYEMKTNTRTYGLVLSSWAKSASPDKAQKAYDILRLMEEVSRTNDNVQSNVHCYNAVINAAAFTDGTPEEREKAFDIASVALDELLEGTMTTADGDGDGDEDIPIWPISSTFGTYIKACGKLALPRSTVEPRIDKAFGDCKKLGLVNEFVLTQIRYSASAEQYQRLMGKFCPGRKPNERVMLKEIPLSWRRNVTDRPIEDGRGDWWRDGGSNVLSPPVARMDSSSNSCFARGKTKKSVNDAVSARQNDLQCATFCEFW
jgi:hypothetical protein